ncbi:MAG: glycosyltransferase [Crocinitomicaceae bacterium]|nr:glycosyltransferase [Crocinitomicaceae bacterium]MBP6032023.1 glycosyltransferase [Crocinitomicaceae bacterium]
MRNKEKLTFFSALPPFRGGIAQFSEQFRKAIAKVRDVESFTFRHQYPNFLFPGQSQFEENHPVFHFPRIVSTFRPWTYLTALVSLRKSKGNVFITSYWMSFFGPMMGFWARFLPKKTVKIALIHNLVPHEKRFFDDAFNRFFLSHYDGFIVLSESVKQAVLVQKPGALTRVLKHPSYQQFGKKMDKQHARQEIGIDATKKTILFFGLIRDYKGLDILLEAFSKMDDAFQLLIAGEVYGERKVYDDLIEQSKNKQVYFVDQFIPSDKVAFYFSASDLCVLPYRTATQSGIKAMCDVFQLPVLVSQVGGLAEDIALNENGFIIEDMSPDALAAQINLLFAEDQLENVAKNLLFQSEKQENEWDEFAESVLEFADMIQQSKKSN